MTRRDRIHAAALARFSRQGYHGTTVREIARDAGICGGSLYAHVPSKEALLFEVLAAVLDGLLQGLRDAVDPEADPATRLYQAIHFHVAAHAAHPDRARALEREWEHLTGAYREQVAARRAAYAWTFAKILAGGITRGDFQPVEVPVVLPALLALGPAAAACAAPNPGPVAAAYADLALRALVPAGPVARPLAPRA